jgi:ATP-dependent Clp protease ATP-binding subunit ClpC
VFERFTDRARSVLVLAQEEARELQHSYIGTEHILLGLVREGDGVGAKVLASFGITLERVRNEVQAILGGDLQGTASPGGNAAPPFTPRAKKVLELSLREALRLGHSYIGTEHILLGIIREGEGVAARTLIGLGVPLSAAGERVAAFMSGHASQGQSSNPAGRARVAQSRRGDRASTDPHCPHCGADVSEEARFRTILVQPDASSNDTSPLQTYVVYCGACGVSLHMFAPGSPT